MEGRKQSEDQKIDFIRCLRISYASSKERRSAGRIVFMAIDLECGSGVHRSPGRYRTVPCTMFSGLARSQRAYTRFSVLLTFDSCPFEGRLYSVYQFSRSRGRISEWKSPYSKSPCKRYAQSGQQLKVLAR